MFVYNHLMDDLGGLSETQLLERMQNIHKNMGSAFAMGKGNMVQQLQVALEMCRNELSRRQQDKSMQQSNEGPNPFKSIDIG